MYGVSAKLNIIANVSRPIYAQSAETQYERTVKRKVFTCEAKINMAR